MTENKRQKPKSARLRYLAVSLPVLVVLLGACLVQECGLELGALPANKERQPQARQTTGRKWAERLDLPGAPNLHKVSGDLYRGAQPSAEGMKQLEKLGIKTVVNLRFLLSDRGELKGTGLAYEHINMTTFHPETEDVVRFLKIVADKKRTPLFVHCHRGADRTGTMCAVYRVAVQGWSKDEAIEEMTQGGFGHHPIWKNLPGFIRKLDIDQIKHAAGMSE
jgi:protein tyrosine/serine phosphatase